MLPVIFLEMKRQFFLLTIFVALTTLGYGQYKPIANGDSISWHLKHEIWDGAILEELVLSDTITLNNKVYFQTFLKDSLFGYFREDTTTGRAWFWTTYDTTEYLIMDLSLNVGDSFLVKVYSDTLVTVSSIDTLNGRKELTLDFCNPS
jgi:hypothetical protein